MVACHAGTMIDSTLATCTMNASKPMYSSIEAEQGTAGPGTALAMAVRKAACRNREKQSKSLRRDLIRPMIPHVRLILAWRRFPVAVLLALCLALLLPGTNALAH